MNRHVLITGAGSGIGRQTAIAFAQQGAVLSLVDLRADAATAVAREAQALGAEAVHVYGTDLRDPEAPAATVRAAWETAPVDVLVNAAGVYPATPFLDLDASTWDAVQNLNVRAPLLSTVVLAQLASAAGRRPVVVNISSGAALRARPGAAPYATSKAALEMATRASALELGPLGIRVNAVAPGFVTVDSEANPVTEEYAAAVSPNPLGRRGRPDDIANAVLWLCSDAAEWITGEVLRVDGGASTGAMNLPLHWEPATKKEAHA
ncbi:NAD(P)-dependent dehydrogenase (short-subunit alcohol dehydrogenase family) [Sinomonas atrocyanea]|uniref:SDR family NAD(P)-dependent oxidoreductase n=1 Tax=Sinomonas atrocyanea TaxID=37927 RepID=UPI002788D833|nr:SDR family oxidoreductase [Sinomonas atrocyanea]MDP9886072.1 NAD(P)-dependent dehydrogenase (short-subunit alcohol dehydrogenase family) [Sinomonas atrocyanea]